MGEFILSYEKFMYSNEDELNEGWRTWMATFMLLLNLGVVPPKIQAANLQDKIEWVQSVPQEQIAIAKFVAMLTREQHISPDDTEEIQNKLTIFNKQSNTKISLDDVLKMSDVQKKSDDDGHKHYKWTLNVPVGDAKFALDINNLKPMRYGSGIALISDYGDFMRPTFEDSLNQVLFKYEKLTGVEIAIVTIPSFYGEEPADYTVKLANKWGVGKKGADNGILIVTSMGDRQYYIATGYGMEDILPDALAKRYAESCLVPNFKEGNYEQGFSELIQEMKDEFGSIPIERKKELDAKYDKIAKENVKDFFIGLGEFALLALVLGLSGYLVYGAVKRRKELQAKILRTKQELEKFNREVAMLIDGGDPMFNDNQVLDGLQKAGQALANINIRREKRLIEISTLLMTYQNELKDIQRIEREINKIKFAANDTVKKLKGYETKPSDMKAVAETALGVLNGMKFESVDLSDASVEKYKRTFRNVQAYYDKYKGLENVLSSVQGKLGEFESTKANLLKKLETAKKYAEEVKKMGYSSEVRTSKEDITNLKNYIDLVGSIFMTDLTRAATMLGEYGAKASAISSELDRPVKTFNDIMSAKKFIDEGDATIAEKLKKIDRYIKAGHCTTREKETAVASIHKYDEIKGGHMHTKEDPYGEEQWGAGVKMSEVLKVAAALQSCYNDIDAVITKGYRRQQEEEAEEERKRQEEERRRRKKREEEEEDRRRRNSYSSSYSSGSSYGGGYSSSDSGSSFGGFGGGSFGGGGAGGSW